MNRKLIPFVFAALCLGAAAPAPAQLEHLNVDTLIKGLREQNMSELLIHLSKNMRDEADATKLKVEMLIMRSQTPAIALPERRQSFKEAVDLFQALILKFRDSNKRPLWQADLSLQLLYAPIELTELGYDFYEFGVPTESQRAAFERCAAIAIESLIDADVTLAKLVRDIPRDDKLLTSFQNSGRWKELKDEYMATRVPFLKAQAAYMAALLPDEHPYYQNLGKNPHLPLQATTPAAERQRLLKLTADDTIIAPELVKEFGVSGRLLALVRGKAMVKLGRFPEGIALLESVVSAEPAENAKDLMSFRAQLAKAVAMDGRDKKPDAALLFLDTLKDHPISKQGPYFLMLIADLEHRLMVKAAGKDKKKIEASYLPYDRLTSDTQRLTQEQLDFMRRQVYTRWADQYKDFKDDQLKDLPPMVTSGMAENERLRGFEYVRRAYELNTALANAKTKDETAALEAQQKAAMNAAQPHLKRAMELAEAQIKSPDVPVEVKARAMYTRAFSKYLQAPQAALNIIEAGMLWADVAEAAPKNPLAEESIGKALDLILGLQNQNVSGKELDEAYARITKILYEKLPDSAAALDHRLLWTFKTMQSVGKFPESIKSYEKIPPSHRDYVQSQRESLYCQLQLLRRMPAGLDRSKRADDIRAEIDKVMRMARKGLQETTDPQEQSVFKKTLADLVLSGADIDIERSRLEDAERALQNFAADYNDPELNSLAMSKLILAKVRQAKTDEATKLLDDLMKAVGNDTARQVAVASLLDTALDSLAEDVERYRAEAEKASGVGTRQQFEEKAATHAKASEKLADQLLSWARTRSVPADQVFRYQVIKIQSLLLNKNREKAIDAIKQLKVDDPTAAKDARVVFMEAESLFLSTTRKDLIESAKLLRTITDEARPPKPSAQMLPRERAEAEIRYQIWWRAWLRFLQILDRLNEQTRIIPDRVRQLRQEDADMGGLALEPQFRSLEEKWKQGK